MADGVIDLRDHKLSDLVFLLSYKNRNQRETISVQRVGYLSQIISVNVSVFIFLAYSHQSRQTQLSFSLFVPNISSSRSNYTAAA